MYNIDKEIFIRNENNGISVYFVDNNDYYFYEELYMDDYFSNNKVLNKKDFVNFLSEHNNKISSNIDFYYPFRINWLVSDICNLNCIYCFADNKLFLEKKKDIDYKKIVNNILKLNPLTVGISGGEPTLIPHLDNIINLLSGNCAIVLDTNGTTDMEKYIDCLKRSNATVRITIDCMDDEMLNKIRISNKKQINVIKKNIKLLLKAKINVIIHTVVTKINLMKIVDIAKFLETLDIKKWQLYPVNYSKKCKDIYDDIKVSDQQLTELENLLNDIMLKKISVKVYRNQVDFSANGVLMVNARGDFFLDSIYNGIIIIGKKGESPTINDIKNNLNIDNHISDYLSYY